MATLEPFNDFESLRLVVKANTVDRLKHIISGFNDECSCSLSKSGKKQDLIDRILNQLDIWRYSFNTDKFTKARSVVYQVRNSGSYIARVPVIISGGVAQTHSTYIASAGPSSASYQSLPSPPSDPRYPLYQRPSLAVAGSSVPRGIIFQASPFLRIDQAASPIVECPESTSAVDRRQQTVSFNLTSEQIQKLNPSSSKYQLRLFCTSSTFHSASNFRVSSAPCPIEFPPACEVRVNNLGLTANLKGLKKKPGTAPPPDLGMNIKLTPGHTNRVEMVYVNSQQPVHGKKYYLVVMLVEVTSVDELVERMKKGKFVSKQDILAEIKQGLTEDDEIIAGPQKMTLKCPLSYIRINTPCRSALCVHRQCFDAASWFSVMEQTTTWLCPVCEKVLKSEDLIVDGYFDDILLKCPESVEDVMVEADGQWHTSDNKFGSADWIATHPSKPDLAPVKERSPSKPLVKVTNGKDRARPSDAEVFILDSDDEDEGRVKRELSPSYDQPVPPGSQQRNGSSQISAVIDLTLESDDEDPPRPTQKRKAIDAPSPTEQIWKKSRSSASISDPITDIHTLSAHRLKMYGPSDYRRFAQSRW